jgi:Putative esterase
MRILIPLLLAAALTSLAQNPGTGHPAASNVPGAQYPSVSEEGRVTFRLKAPQAQTVQVRVGATYDMKKDAEGVWTVTTPPLVPGFHYYWLVIDGVSVNDPASETYFGVSKESSGIEVPEPGVDYYAAQNVPHGEIRSHWYWSKITGAWRRFFLYTPPGYDTDVQTRYPVLYLQHGGGEDERGWVIQGRVNFILDNLIAAKSAKPMLVVMDNGYALKPGEMPPGPPPASGTPPPAQPNRPSIQSMTANFDDVMIREIIPTVDMTYRTIKDRDHRAMAGLSMGGMQTFYVTLNHLDKFSYIGGFSGSGGMLGCIRSEGVLQRCAQRS